VTQPVVYHIGPGSTHTPLDEVAASSGNPAVQEALVRIQNGTASTADLVLVFSFMPALATPSDDIGSLPAKVTGAARNAARERMETEEQNIEANARRQKTLRAEVEKAIADAQAAEKEAKEAAETAKIWGWVGAALAIVGAAIAIGLAIFSAGAGTGAAVAAVGMAALAVNQVMNMTFQEMELEYVSMTGERRQLDVGFKGIVDLGTDILETAGAFDGWSQEQKANYRLGMTIGLTLVATIALAYLSWTSVGGSIGSGVNAGINSANNAVRGASALERAASAATITTEGMEFTTSMVQAGYQFWGAIQTFQADQSEANRQKFEAYLKALAQAMENSNETLVRMMDALNEVFKRMSDYTRLRNQTDVLTYRNI
jgi:hypothetical protein